MHLLSLTLQMYSPMLEILNKPAGIKQTTTNHCVLAHSQMYEFMYFEIMLPVLKEYFKTYHWWVMRV
jgi:hypothetical protein